VAGGERFFTDIAMALMGRRRGGAAKISILSSVLFGTVSGSAVANVVVGGAITIGMMKRNGYPPHTAAAIEAVASTGGQIMPPVMGITAFLIAENLNVPYGQVALAALVPALLYYIALFVQADLEAAKLGLRGAPRSELPRARDVMRRGWVFLVPLGALVYLLVIESYRADFAGLVAAATTLLLPLIYSRDHMKTRKLLAIFERTGRGMLDLTVVCALAGVIMGALNLSGILFKSTLILSSLSFGHPLVLLAVVAAICIVLGMGLPSIVIYVLLAVLLAPALTALGVTPMAAHLFIFYFGMLSMITPPVALATFAAMSIAGSRLWPTGWAGMKLGIVAYIVPFIFALQPALLLDGQWLEVALSCLTAMIGVWALSVGCVGFLFRRLRSFERWGFFASGLALVPAPDTLLLAAINIAGGIVALALVSLVWTQRSYAETAPATQS
jgi:TRAP transporter 4TM/12TM fusion protein